MKEYAVKRLSSLTPEGSGSDCGHACHTIVKVKDYIFTAYGKR
jgi:hypothetical protein